MGMLGIDMDKIAFQKAKMIGMPEFNDALLESQKLYF